MFDKKPKSYTDLGKTNRIVEGTIIKGDINSPADFRLDGILEGNFISAGKLVIGSTGKIKGTIVAKNADIEGAFDGKINVEEILTLKSTASVHGEVVCGKLAVENGANFTATCSMKSSVKNLNSDGQKEKTA